VIATGVASRRGWCKALAVGKAIVVFHVAIVVWLLHRRLRIRGLVESRLIVVGGSVEALVVGRAVLRVTRVTAKRQVEGVLFGVHAGQCIDSDRESDGADEETGLTRMIFI
jgi:hypothetical protein